MKVADGALASMDKTRLEFVEAISSGHKMRVYVIVTQYICYHRAKPHNIAA